jgi:hypothetical protein
MPSGPPAAGFPIALGDEMWQKYKIGEAFKIVDPEAKAPAVKNPFLHPKPGVLLVDDMALERLLANGTVIGVCNVTLQVQSKMFAGNAGVSADEAAKDWAANVVPGRHHHSIRNMGGEPRAGSRLHVLRRRLNS